MSCPNCEVPLNKVDASSHYGMKIELDQCPQCGGVWCDDLEMNSVHPDSARAVEIMDVQRLVSEKPIKGKMVCPKDGTILQDFKDPFFPQQIKLEYCPKCSGFWFNRGEFAEFKEWQQEKKEASKNLKFDSEADKVLLEQMEKLAALERGSNYGMWEALGKDLNRPVYIADPLTLNDVPTRPMGVAQPVVELLFRLIMMFLRR